MNSMTRAWRAHKFGRKFAKFGKKVRFFGPNVHIDGHVECGDGCRFRDQIWFRTRGEGKIIFGTNSGCGHYVILEATESIEIGSHTWLSEFTVIRDTTHLIYGTAEHWAFTPTLVQPVKIGEDCWIGSRCYINPGVTIGNGAVVGVGSVVTKDIPELEVWAGTPARRISHRIEDISDAKKEESERLIAEKGVKKMRY